MFSHFYTADEEMDPNAKPENTNAEFPLDSNMINQLERKPTQEVDSLQQDLSN